MVLMGPFFFHLLKTCETEEYNNEATLQIYQDF